MKENNCDFCKDIYNYDLVMNTLYRNVNTDICIVFEDGVHRLLARCDDDYTDSITEINYCPKCGRKLND